MLVATASARATEIRAQKDFGVCESRAVCRNIHAEWYAKIYPGSRESLDARNHIAFNGISHTYNTPALEIASEYLPLSSRSRTLTPSLSVVPRVTLAHPHSRSFPLCFDITLVRATQSRLPNIHRLLILLTVCE